MNSAVHGTIPGVGPDTPREAVHFEVTARTVQAAAVVPVVQGFVLWFLLRAEQAVIRRRVGVSSCTWPRPPRWSWPSPDGVEFAWLDLMPGHGTASVLELAVGRSVVELEELGVEIVNNVRHR